MPGYPIVALGDYFRIKHGFAFKGEFFSESGDFILLSPGNFEAQGGLKLKGEKEKYYAGDIPPDFVLACGDLIVAMTDLTQAAPILGAPAVIPESGRFLHNQRLGKVVDLDLTRLDRDYLFFLFNLASVRAQIKASATGATVKHTAPDRIYSVRAPVPRDIGVQRCIAGILSTYDDLIENNTKRIKILEEMVRSLYREWFVNFRFPGRENVKLVNSSVGKIPDTWAVRELRAYGKVVTGKTPSKTNPENFGQDVPFIKLPDMHGQIFCLDTQEKLSRSGADGQAGKYLPPDSVCVSCIGSAGVVCIAAGQSQTNQQINSIIPASPHLREFLYITMTQLKDRLNRLGSSGATMTNVNKAKFSGIETVWPGEAVVEQFHRAAGPLFDTVCSLQTRNSLLRTTRDLLLPRLVSGEIEVPSLPSEPTAS